jgi:hypothetical protein
MPKEQPHGCAARQAEPRRTLAAVQRGERAQQRERRHEEGKRQDEA